MRPLILEVSCLTLACLCGYGQASNASSFEVASIKPASPSPTRIGCSGGPGTTDPGIWSCSNVPLGFLVSNAYDFQPYQFAPGDNWSQARFDITARVPAGTTKEQFLRMQQILLAERFKLTLHHEQKEMAIYELTVGEKGLKMKESVPESVPDAAPAPEGQWTAPKFTIGKDSYPAFPAGQGGLVGMNGYYRWKGVNLSMQEIVKTLSSQLGRPVIDATQLKAKYDIDLTWTIDLASILERAGVPEAVREAPDNGGPPGPTLIGAVQSQLGLKLNSKKGPGDIVVVDHVERVPTEN